MLKIPVCCNDRKGWDGHFIIQETGTHNIEVSVIPSNIENSNSNIHEL